PHRNRGEPHASRPRAAACQPASAPTGADRRTGAPSGDQLPVDQAVINGQAPSAATRSTVLARLLTPPTGLLARTRWLFLLASLMATGILGPLLVVVGPADWPHKLAACAALAGVGVSWVLSYRRGRLSPIGDIVEGLALVVMGTTLYFGLGVL